MYDIHTSTLRAELSWNSSGVKDSTGSHTGTLSEVCDLFAAEAPAGHQLDADALAELVLKGYDLIRELDRVCQVIVIETALGWVVARFGPANLFSPRRRTPSTVHVSWRNSRQHGGEHVAKRRWGLARRIARTAGVDGPAYVRIYLDRAIAAEPAADLHKFRLLPRNEEGGRRGLVDVVIDRRGRIR